LAQIFKMHFSSGGGALNPLEPAAGHIPDAAMFGVRRAINF
jgi:hypothetical protein